MLLSDDIVRPSCMLRTRISKLLFVLVLSFQALCGRKAYGQGDMPQAMGYSLGMTETEFMHRVNVWGHTMDTTNYGESTLITVRDAKGMVCDATVAEGRVVRLFVYMKTLIKGIRHAFTVYNNALEICSDGRKMVNTLDINTNHDGADDTGLSRIMAVCEKCSVYLITLVDATGTYFTVGVEYTHPYERNTTK